MKGVLTTKSNRAVISETVYSPHSAQGCWEESKTVRRRQAQSPQYYPLGTSLWNQMYQLPTKHCLMNTHIYPASAGHCSGKWSLGIAQRSTGCLLWSRQRYNYTVLGNCIQYVNSKRFFSVLWREMMWGCYMEHGLFWSSLYWASQAAPLTCTRHTASPLPNSDVTVKWSLPASTNKIFECQRFKNCHYTSRLNSFISYLRNNFLSLKLEIESCSSDNCTVQAQWCHEHTQGSWHSTSLTTGFVWCQ